MNYLKYFIEDNKSGHKTRETWLKANNIDLYNKIIDFCVGELEDITFKEKVWHFINDEKLVKKCECGKKLKFKKSLKGGYGKYCSIKCGNNSASRVEAIKKTNLERYGVASTLQVEEVKDKIKSSIKEKPSRYVDGIEYVFVNGKMAIEKGEHTGALAGMVLRHQSSV